jgi:hypothetical protein
VSSEKLLPFHQKTRSQSYGRELQRQRCKKIYHATSSQVRFEGKNKLFSEPWCHQRLGGGGNPDMIRLEFLPLERKLKKNTLGGANAAFRGKREQHLKDIY